MHFLFGEHRLGLSMSIEVIQLVFRLGLFEWDDMIHNTLGCVLGTVIIEKAYRGECYGSQPV